jgi:hypothetical protein
MRRGRKAVFIVGPLLAAVSVVGCSGSDGGPDPVTLESVTLEPASVTLASGASQSFTATAHMSDGGALAATVTWSATGGSVSGAGVYTAGGTPGEFIVVATAQGSTLADTAFVTIPAPPPPNLVAVEVTPPAASLQSGLSLQFTAIGRLSDNSTIAVPVTWSATGGTVSAGGIYTAGAAPGIYRVIATEIGGAALADTAVVTVSAALVAVEVSPPTATVVTGATQQFAAVGRYSDNSTQSVPVTWTATGGTIDSNGLFTAGATAGSAFRVVATLAGGTLADTSLVTVSPPPSDIVAILISPDSMRIKPYDSTAVSAVGRRGDGSTVPVAVTWTSTAGTVSALGNFVAGPVALGRYTLIARQAGGGTLADTIPVTLHGTTGESVIGPDFWTPTPGAVHLCTSNHFTDDPVGLTATATIAATPDVGVLAASKPYATLTWGSYSPFPDGPTIDFVRVVCEKVFELPVGYTDPVKVRISVSSYSAGSGMAKIFKYENRNNPQSRADFTPPSQDWSPPNWTTAQVAESVFVSPTNGANIWFKNTKVPF